jgi:coproporphyrinogen III oxidase
MPMLKLDDQQQAVGIGSIPSRPDLRRVRKIEREAGSDASFTYTPGPNRLDWRTRWRRSARQMGGRFSKKSGERLDRRGHFSQEFARSIPGAEEDPSFFATGISLAHGQSACSRQHMNMRFLFTTKRWFGGAATQSGHRHDEDTEAFHARMRRLCGAIPPSIRASQSGPTNISGF